MTSALGLKFSIVAITKKSVVVRIRLDVDVAPVPAIAAGRSAARDVLLPAKRDAAIAPIAGLYRNFGFVCKHESPARKRCRETIRRCWAHKQKYAPRCVGARKESCRASWRLPQRLLSPTVARPPLPRRVR